MSPYALLLGSGKSKKTAGYYVTTDVWIASGGGREARFFEIAGLY
jgi:hypothetical protein